MAGEAGRSVRCPVVAGRGPRWRTAAPRPATGPAQPGSRCTGSSGAYPLERHEVVGLDRRPAALRPILPLCVS